MKRPLLLGVMVAYVLLVLAIYWFLDWPWNLGVASLLLFKGFTFIAILGKAGKIGKGRTPPF